MDSERFRALLSHQGPLVHVDHSHRAPARTTGERDPEARFNLKDWLEGTADKEIAQQRKYERERERLKRKEEADRIASDRKEADEKRTEVNNDKAATEARRAAHALSATAGEVRGALERMPNERFDVQLNDDNNRTMHFSFEIGKELGVNRGYLVISVHPVDAPKEKWTDKLGPGLDPHKLWSSKTELTDLFEEALERLFEEAKKHGYNKPEPEPRPWWAWGGR